MDAKSMLSRIGFVGAGRVAQTLAGAFSGAGYPVVAVSSRSAANLADFRARCPAAQVMETPQEAADKSTIVFLTVSDDAIAPVCAGVRWRPGCAVVHCSGATEVAALAAAADAGAWVGGFHPMQMFANPDVALAGLPGCTVGIEAQGPLLEALRQLAQAIGCVPFSLPAGVRPLYHASAYYVGPFLIALLKEGAELWARFGATERQAMEAMLPLLRGTVAAAMDGGLARGMGGCVARGDIGTIRKHLDALESIDLAMANLYRELAVRNIPLAVQRGTLPPSRAAEIAALLQGAPAQEPAA
ncbi:MULTISPECIES: Rossmann-like and DUF2520 domain-containing protein [unclassified Herbaspirillum]|uniref:Rossmann-like and DUF2520 domain-containing protein n=1 Tax=unclassified Herbaspirillum TaxID=2624150 RepID=UPI00114DD718|nr:MULTISPECIES: DUF2520 domain-containing protein [unclassified Herbaspirillum]MBB5390657.1 putative short-subunit dehydrogenase-like oxidoreductase (DUF2520 family) [Herbaspirillum sp. SJZ102]TQK08857.1 putative short-subunit dehydrogenase-like oxidoreductase (DUF2520 family) [Herbaspirillum sp. SJZ130]TQK14456.1 putative short-subunit dehydrogenase-like oxidoreductase (DUF2520 family) [Herbaspirillum sp. SJZ106]TWC66527.1 putative short-subunit dehydrogenase-like oxidoreductase (DUF2520 fami